MGSNHKEIGTNTEPQDNPASRAQCPVCMTAFSSTIKILGCGHSFCYECLLAVWGKSTNRANIQCPLCRQETSVPNRNPSRLTTNFGMMEVLGMQVVDTTHPEMDESIMQPWPSFSVNRARFVDNDISQDVPSHYYPVTVMVWSSISMEEYEMDHMQGHLEDYMIEEEDGSMEDDE